MNCLVLFFVPRPNAIPHLPGLRQVALSSAPRGQRLRVSGQTTTFGRRSSAFTTLRGRGNASVFMYPLVN